MAGSPHDRRPWLRLANAGFELAAAIGGFVLVGYWVDRHFGVGPWGVLTGALLGLVGGMYNLVKGALVASREAREDDVERERDS